jgi:uncharacterized membrane protein YecN with MAPEG domain
MRARAVAGRLLEVVTLVPITGFYAAIAAIILLCLAFNVSFARVRSGVMTGDGGHADMLGPLRAHGNAVEYLPIALIVMMTLELEHGSIVLLHVIGVLLVVGRLLHAFGLLRTTGSSFGRFWGFICTVAAILLASGAVLVQVFLFSGALTTSH